MANWNQIVGPALDSGDKDRIQDALDLVNGLLKTDFGGDTNLLEAKALCEAVLKTSPAVQEHAANLGVDLTQVSGTGKDGAITKSDVSAAAEQQAAPPPPPTGV